MRKIIIDSGKEIYETPRKINNNNSLGDLIHIDEEYRSSVEVFHNLFINNIDEKLLERFYSNIDNVQIKKAYIKGIIYNILISGIYADYDITSNTITYYQKVLSNSCIGHELLHLSSSICDKENKIYYSGISQINESVSLGDALNEGYTDYLCSIMYGEINTYYKYEMVVAKLIEQTLGSTMKEMYFNADLYSFFQKLSEYTSVANIKNFLCKMDYILNNRITSTMKNKSHKYILDINYFLLQIYSNQLIDKINKKQISKKLALELYKKYVLSMNELLEVPLSIDKDRLRTNLADNNEIQLSRIKKII